MGVMIACSPSTGSSLLRRVLNRHSKLFCGPESSLLSKEELYTNWTSYKNRLKANAALGLKESAWHHFRGINLDEEFGLTNEEFDRLIDNSDSYISFTEQFFKIPLLRYNKELWIEKTPSNAFTAKLFLENFNDAKLIHITRNPYDTIASLVNRGISVFQATAVCLLNTCELLQLKNDSSHYLLKYEDLVREPEKTLTGLLEFLGYEFEEPMLQAKDHFNKDNFIKGWNYKETDPIGKNSINKFDELTKEMQYEIIQSAQLLKSTIHNDSRSIEDICASLNYNFKDKDISSFFKFKFRLLKYKDGLYRTLGLRYFNWFNYPLLVSND